MSLKYTRLKLEHLQIANDDEFASIWSAFDVEDVKSPITMRFVNHGSRQIGEGDLTNRPIRGDLLNVARVGPRRLGCRVGIGELNLKFGRGVPWYIACGSGDDGMTE